MKANEAAWWSDERKQWVPLEAALTDEIELTYPKALDHFGHERFAKILAFLSEQPVHRMTTFRVGMQMYRLV